jgi:hypothetical protein
LRRLPDSTKTPNRVQNFLAVDAPKVQNDSFNSGNQGFYSEHEAARWLGITLTRLHELLDQNIFNDGSRRPQNLQFNNGDLLLLSYWNEG